MAKPVGIAMVRNIRGPAAWRTLMDRFCAVFLMHQQLRALIVIGAGWALCSWWLRCFHVDPAMHVNRTAVLLRTPPWHYAFRPNVADHWVVRYSTGLYEILPCQPEIMPKFEHDSDLQLGRFLPANITLATAVHGFAKTGP
jgi:hypothetical protein